MAISWETQITNVDLQQKRADVTFTRTDDTTGAVETYSFSKVIIETTQQRLDLLDLVWQKHLAAVANQTNIDAFITNLEQLANSNLDAREVA